MNNYRVLSETYNTQGGSSVTFATSTRSDGDTGPSGQMNAAKLAFLGSIAGRDAKILAGTQVHGLSVVVAHRTGPGLRFRRYTGSWVGAAAFSVSSVEIDGTADLLFPETDGFLTDHPDLVPAVSVADCLPLAVWADDIARGGLVRGIFHSGWAGTGILYTGLAAIQDIWGISASSVSASFGPGICGICYRVDASRARTLTSRFGAGVAKRLPQREGWGEEYGLDLFECNLRIAQQTGLTVHRSLAHCTCENSYLWSHRNITDIDGRALSIIARSG